MYPNSICSKTNTIIIQKTPICGLTVPIADVHELVRNDKVSVVRGSRRRHRQAVHVKDARRNGEQSNGLADNKFNAFEFNQNGPDICSLTIDAMAASMALRCTSKYLLFSSSGLRYHGTATDRIDLERCEAKFVDDLHSCGQFTELCWFWFSG